MDCYSCFGSHASRGDRLRTIARSYVENEKTNSSEVSNKCKMFSVLFSSMQQKGSS